MGYGKCCVVDCKNTKVKRNDLKFYTFPTASHRQKQRLKWIQSIRRQNPDGTNWVPKPHAQICSAHFAGNQMSIAESSPSHIPTIFPVVYKKSTTNEGSSIQRFNRYMKRHENEWHTTYTETSVCTASDENIDNNSISLEESFSYDEHLAEDNSCTTKPLTSSIGCQAYILKKKKSKEEGRKENEEDEEQEENSKTFICNTKWVSEKYTDCEIQTDISECNKVIVKNRKKRADKKCGPEIKYADASTQASGDIAVNQGFIGIESITNDEQMVDLAGISRNHYNLFLHKIVPDLHNCKVSKENRLLIFFMKFKTGLSFSAISVLFQVHRTTVSRIFHFILNVTASALRNSIEWIDKDTVQGLMPECFKPNYYNVRVIIDCTEFPIEIPASVANRVHTYSHYKKGFTAKVLIGCAPNGIITFKSAVAGGRKSDSQITIESGLLDLLEADDVILADKGFPEIKSKIDESGKRVTLVMPPFLRDGEFTEEECERTYSVANVRIHIERIMQRIKLYNIFNKIPSHLFDKIDDILLICCILVNLQKPIIAVENDVT